MKTTSLAKAPMGSVAYVIEPNQMGYTELVNIPVGKISFQDLIDGMKAGIEEANKKNEELRNELEKVLSTQAEEIIILRKAIEKITKAFGGAK